MSAPQNVVTFPELINVNSGETKHLYYTVNNDAYCVKASNMNSQFSYNIIKGSECNKETCEYVSPMDVPLASNSNFLINLNVNNNKMCAVVSNKDNKISTSISNNKCSESFDNVKSPKNQIKSKVRY
jgi:hypothetical protein